jgi:hypothetical protein
MHQDFTQNMIAGHGVPPSKLFCHRAKKDREKRIAVRLYWNRITGVRRQDRKMFRPPKWVLPQRTPAIYWGGDT